MSHGLILIKPKVSVTWYLDTLDVRGTGEPGADDISGVEGNNVLWILPRHRRARGWSYTVGVEDNNAL